MKRILLLLALVFPLAAFAQVEVSNLRVNRLAHPMGISSEQQPVLSWICSSPVKNSVQTAYEVVVTSSGKKVWSSGKVASDNSTFVVCDLALTPDTRYDWSVRVWDNHGNVSPWSDVQRFGVGILSAEEWQGEYIGMKDCTVPQVRQQFEVKDKSATYMLHVNSLGYHEVYLNGEKVTDNVLPSPIRRVPRHYPLPSHH